jgi:hypothetical protein
MLFAGSADSLSASPPAKHRGAFSFIFSTLISVRETEFEALPEFSQAGSPRSNRKIVCAVYVQLSRTFFSN